MLVDEEYYVRHGIDRARDTKREIEPVSDFRDRIGGGGGAIYPTKSDIAIGEASSTEATICT